MKQIIRQIEKVINYYSMLLLKRTTLWPVLESILKNTPYIKKRYKHYYKYLRLYKDVKKYKYKEILECGSGISTVIMAKAIQENGGGRITSMEENDGEYIQNIKDLIPDDLKQYVDIRYSPKVDDYYQQFRGVRYRDIPDRKYDFMFIDGPTTKSVADGQNTFDFDYIKISQELGEIPVIIDGRVSTFKVLRQLYKGFKFNRLLYIGYKK